MSSVEQSGFAPGDLVHVEEVPNVPMGWESPSNWYGIVVGRDGHLSSGTGWAKSRVPVRPVDKLHLRLVSWMKPAGLELVQRGEQ